MQKSVRLFIAAASAAAILSTPALAADGDAGWREITYRCASGQDLTVGFRDAGGAIRVTAGDRPTVKLVGRPAKAGFRYGDSRHELRGEGNTVTLKIGSKTPLECTTDDPAAADLAAAATTR